MMVFITPFLKNATFKPALKRLFACCLCVILLHFDALAAPTELTQLRVERADDGVYLSAVVQFDLPAAVEDALTKGIAIFFVVEADIYQNRWYWTDRRIASATRSIRLSFQPLSRRWRVNIGTGLINNPSGLRATLNQNYESLPEALSAVQRLSRWKVADSAELDPEVVYKLQLSFNMDLSQLPRPFQIGVAGQKDWTISAQQTERLQVGPARSYAPNNLSSDKPKATSP